ncbi:hypothetical protein [Prescottella subtropica]|uniref:hypothetical protein n=1 Tax=Prescottella subtropica TaxID=2545757 RepID=UPI0010F57F07|nr:hypothetical protein [Prescottella subtropica]
MADFDASSAFRHYQQALDYERRANEGIGDADVHAQLAVMHATLAAAATNIALIESQDTNARLQRELLSAIETGVGTIAKTIPSKLNDVSDSIAEVAARMPAR